MMREVLGLEVREIAEQLGISTNNCHVVLHRARAKLRAALEITGSGPGVGHDCSCRRALGCQRLNVTSCRIEGSSAVIDHATAMRT